MKCGWSVGGMWVECGWRFHLMIENNYESSCMNSLILLLAIASRT